MKPQSQTFLKNMLACISPSGYENETAAVWQKEAKKFADKVTCDVHGNTHAVINPGGKVRIMFAGHYDEIGFIITHIDDRGFCWIGPVGGWDPQIPQGHHVVIRGTKGHVPGVIGKSPIHLLGAEARTKVTQIDQLWVDLGAKDKKAAEKLVSVGDPLVLGYGYQELQGDLVAARGMDDRAGAFVVLEAARMLAKMNPKAEIHAVATVQEEIGLRGATTAAFEINPHVGIAVDVTFATDYPTMGEAVKRENKIDVGGGPVITRGANINSKLFDLFQKVGKEENIPLQVTAEPRGTGTDANVIQLNRSGVATGLVGIPNRYMHSPCEIVSKKDLVNCSRLLAETAVRITPRTSFIPYPVSK